MKDMKDMSDVFLMRVMKAIRCGRGEDEDLQRDVFELGPKDTPTPPMILQVYMAVRELEKRGWVYRSYQNKAFPKWITEVGYLRGGRKAWQERLAPRRPGK